MSETDQNVGKLDVDWTVYDRNANTNASLKSENCLPTFDADCTYLKAGFVAAITFRPQPLFICIMPTIYARMHKFGKLAVLLF